MRAPRPALNDAVKVGFGKLEGLPVVIAVQDFDFMGGSLGMAAGEAIVRGARDGGRKGMPFIVFAASGGARMQEGMLSLMQMPRTTVAVQMLREARQPYIVVLTNPTTGGVTASYAMLGDVQIAEPGALIGFAGAARDRADHPRETAGGFSARRISQGPRHGRHGGASSRVAGDAGAAVPAADQGAGDRDRRRTAVMPTSDAPAEPDAVADAAPARACAPAREAPAAKPGCRSTTSSRGSRSCIPN